MRIGTRLYAGVGIVVVLFITVVASVYVNFSKAGAANESNIRTYDVISQLDGLHISLINMEVGERGYALAGKNNSLEPFTTGKEEYAKKMANLKALALNPVVLGQLNTLNSMEAQWVTETLEPAIDLRQEVNKGEAQLGDMATFQQAGSDKLGLDAMLKLLTNARDLEMNLLREQHNASERLASLTVMTILIGAGLASLLAFATSILLKRSIARPLLKAVKIAEQVAGGDLTSDIVVESKDELGQLLGALKIMNDGLQEIVTKVRTGTDIIATASQEIAGGNLDLSSRTEEQASSLEETASSMEELASTVKHNADSAKQANQMAIEASEVAANGGKLVGDVVNSMSLIDASSKKIVDIISVIDGIAFQTNILALNAAVEAARAGEQGRGFAVVASEVRSLAQRSAAAAKEIKTLIGDSVNQVSIGSRLVESAGEMMKRVVESVKRVTDVVGEISNAGQEQSHGIEQVNRAILQMDEVTQQNAALVEEAAAAAQALQDQAATLLETVEVFKLHPAGLTADSDMAPVNGAEILPLRRPVVLSLVDAQM
jgi:methyl-accepting chemotaxis protein